ncbi:MAG: hypothetical protein E7637_02730 [Ruminococcaceae bacterium]|nr:hypothetical protein [Oscillospiraceae bacterium]
MNYYQIKRADQKIDWSSVASLEIGCRYLDTPQKIKAFAQICYNDEGIQVHLWSENDDVRAVEVGHLGAPYEDSCLEFFFAPMEGDVRYFNIEFNSNCCLYLGLGRCMEDHTRLIHEEEGANILSPKASLTDTGWEIFYTVPYKLIRRFFPDFEITKGKTIRANCFKCADLTTPANYLSWNPVDPTPFTFHKPECFGVMEFDA